MISSKLQRKDLRFYEYLSTIQIGDLLLKQITQAIVVIGMPKVGKTTLCHHLLNHILITEKYFQDLVYTLKDKSELITVKINSTEGKETILPNIFKTNIKNQENKQNITLIDLPGLNDDRSFYSLLSSGYFNYYSFAQIPRLKFVIVFDINDLKGTANNFITTILNFMRTFVNFDSIKQSIFAATCIAITKVQEGTSVFEIKQRVLSVRKQCEIKLNQMWFNKLTLFIENVVQKQKIFLFYKPSKKITQTQKNTLLNSINSSTQYWSRQFNHQYSLGLSNPNQNISFQINEQLGISCAYSFYTTFEQELKMFDNLEGQRLRLFMQTKLIQILQFEANLNKTFEENQVFYDNLQQVVKQQFKYFNQCHVLRQEKANSYFASQLQRRIFDQQINKNKSNGNKLGLTNFQMSLNGLCWWKKLNYQTNMLHNLITNNFQAIMLQKYITNIFKILMRNKNMKQTIILINYHYLLQRVINQYKIILKLMDELSYIRNKFRSSGFQFKPLFRYELLPFIQAQFSQSQISRRISSFVIQEQMKFTTKNTEIINSLFSLLNIKKINKKNIYHIIVKYCQFLCTQKHCHKQDLIFSIQNLKYCQQFFSEQKTLALKQEQLTDQSQHLKQQDQTIKQFNEILFKINNLLGHSHCALGQFKLARQFYKSISNFALLFQTYEREIKTLKRHPKIARVKLIEYGDQALLHHRRELAMKCLQEAYALSTKVQQFQEIKGYMNALADVIQESAINKINNMDEMECCEQIGSIFLKGQDDEQ